MAQVAAVVGKGLGTAAQVVGYQQAADSARTTGHRKNVASQFEAEQLEQQAGQNIAASQRDMQDERRKSNLLASRALALAGASGAGASDPTVLKIISGLKGEGSLRAATALYKGEESARRIRMGASGKRYEGLVAEEAGLNQGAAYDTLATAALFEGASSMASKYK
jgi:hypothetical protein